MLPSPRAMPHVRPAPAICARVWTSTGSRLHNDADLEPNLDVDHPRLPAAVESHAGSALPLLSQLLLLCAYRDRTSWSAEGRVARPVPPSTMSSIQPGRVRPGAGQENDQCLTPAFSSGSRS